MIIVPLLFLFALLLVLLYLVFSSSDAKSDASKKHSALPPNGVYVRKLPPENPQTTGFSKHKLAIYFGSQTGTAEGYARVLMQEARRNRIDAVAVDLEHFSAVKLQRTRFAVFLMATYGEGEPTDNAKRFVRWLQKEARDEALEDLNFAVFGLGSSSYEQFNTIGKLVDARCAALGGKRLIPLVLGDEDKNMLQDFSDFRREVLAVVAKQFGITHVAAPVKQQTFRMRMQTFSSEQEAVLAGTIQSRSMLEGSSHKLVDMLVTHVRELVKGGDEDGRSCVHVELSIAGTATKYVTGDHVAIFPRNDDKRVQELAQLVGADLEMWISMVDADGSAPFPCPCTVRQALTCFVDVSAAPSRHMLQALAECARTAEDRQLLQSLARPEGHALYESFIIRARRSVLEMLRECKSVKVSLAQLLELCPRLQPRYYSISSPSNTHPESVHVTCTVVREDVARPGGHVFEGVCSSYLARLRNGDTVRGFMRATTFKLPLSPSTSVILIGAGAGIAPLRAMMLHLDHVRKAGQTLTGNMLVYGCRKSNHDFLYEDEVLRLARDGTLSHVLTAFSREGAQKVYVQHKIEQHAVEILSVLNSGASIYVCGSSAMAADVRKALVVALVQHVKTTVEKADRFLANMRSGGKYLQDVW